LVNLVQEFCAELRVGDDTVSFFKGPAIRTRNRVHDRHADHVLQTFQEPENHCPVGPRTGIGNVEMIAPGFGLKPAIASWSGLAARRYPVTNFRVGADETAVFGFGVTPLVVPLTVNQKAHVSLPLLRIPEPFDLVECLDAIAFPF